MRPEPLSTIERLTPSQQDKEHVAWDTKKVLEHGDITLRVTLSKGASVYSVWHSTMTLNAKQIKTKFVLSLNKSNAIK